MKRSLLVSAAALLTLLTVPAAPTHAEPTQHESYQNSWVNVFWYSRHRIDLDTYRLTTWYAGAYVYSGEEEGEESLWSDLYRYVSECEKREGSDRCRGVRRLSWYGDTARGTFTIDSRLETSHLEASYRLFRRSHGERTFVGRFHVSTDVTGVGMLAHGRNTYTSHLGCVSFSYGGRWTSRQGTATGTLARGDEDPRVLGETDDAWMGTSEEVSTYHEC
jgi:hypothetical protein